MGVFYDKVRITLSLQSMDGRPVPLLVSKGVEPGENVREPIELTIMDNGRTRSVLVIPSTSIKGVLRTIAYPLLKHLAESNKLSGLAKYSAILHEEDIGGRYWHTLRLCGENKKLTSEEIKELSSLISESLRREDMLKIVYSTLGRNIVAIRRQGGGRVRLEVKPNIARSLEKDLCSCLSNNNCRNLVELVLSYHCPLDRLFGSQYFKGKMSVKSILIDHEHYQRVPRPHVAIDRAKQVKVEQALYVDHVVYVNKLDVEVVVYDIEQGGSEELLLNLLLDYVEKAGIHLGSGKSTGYGYLRLVEKKIRRISYDELHKRLEEKKIDEVVDKMIS